MYLGAGSPMALDALLPASCWTSERDVDGCLSSAMEWAKKQKA